ncbi:hypothetical protein F5884DRAFT_145570 [Xylogone sp. PMI_703]|nr:hypothetical protein F5884DRAFT_145570 [Xylogone sp. PMI_703]
MSKVILVIGGTGAQGFVVIKALANSNSSFVFRVLSRDPDNARVKAQFKGLPIEFVKGSFTDIAVVRNALSGCYATFVNIDGFSVRPYDEVGLAISIYEAANNTPGVRQFVWGGLDYVLKVGKFNPKYGAYHANAKGRFSDYLRSQPSPSATGLEWTIFDSLPYTDMFQGGLIQPTISAGGTRIFAYPLSETARLPLITLEDLGAFAKLIFIDPKRWSGKTFSAGSHYVTGPEIAQTFTRVTGLAAKYETITHEEWAIRWGTSAKLPYSTSDPKGPTMAENFAMLWPVFEDGLFKRDIEALRQLHPGLESLEDWMRRTNYDGNIKPVLKKGIDMIDKMRHRI